MKNKELKILLKQTIIKAPLGLKEKIMEKLEIIESTWQDFDYLLDKKGFHKEGNFYSKFKYKNRDLKESIKYEIHKGMDHLTIFEFHSEKPEQYEFLETVLYKGFISSRKQLIKILNYYF
jgi:hypothetical protein